MGFVCALLIDMPHPSRAYKIFLCATKRADAAANGLSKHVDGDVQNAAPSRSLLCPSAPRRRRVSHAHAYTHTHLHAHTDTSHSLFHSLLLFFAPARTPPPLPLLKHTHTQICPLAWPQAGGCVCTSSWLGIEERPTTYAPRLQDSGCCSSLTPSSMNSVSSFAIAAWMQTLYHSCEAHTRANESSGGGGGDRRAQSASVERLQQQHVKHVRRILYSLAATEADLSAYAAPLSSTPSIKVSLYMSGGRTSASTGATTAPTESGQSQCEHACIIRMEGHEGDMEQLANTLPPLLAMSHTPLLVQHAHCESIAASSSSSTASSSSGAIHVGVGSRGSSIGTTASTSAATSTSSPAPALTSDIHTPSFVTLCVAGAAPHVSWRMRARHSSIKVVYVFVHVFVSLFFECICGHGCGVCPVCLSVSVSVSVSVSKSCLCLCL